MWMSPLRIHSTMHESVTDSIGLAHLSHSAYFLPCILPYLCFSHYHNTLSPPKFPAPPLSCPFLFPQTSPSSPLCTFRKLEGCDMKIYGTTVSDESRREWKRLHAYRIGLILICIWILTRLIRWMYFPTQTSHSHYHSFTIPHNSTHAHTFDEKSALILMRWSWSEQVERIEGAFFSFRSDHPSFWLHPDLRRIF